MRNVAVGWATAVALWTGWACTSGGTPGPGSAAAADVTVVTVGGDSASAGGGDAKGGDAVAGDSASGDAKTDGGDALAAQDTGRVKDDIAKHLADAAKAEDDVYAALCKHALKCESSELWLADAKACKAELFALGGLTFFADGKAAIAAGRAKWNGASLAACLATFDGKCTFSDSPRLPEPCAALFAGLVDAGFACDRDVDCKSSYCKKKDVNDVACPGVCAATSKAGAACDTDEVCEAPLVCGSDGTCAAYKPAAKGEDCADVLCADGLVCITSGDSYVCADPAGEGAACEVGDYACKGGLYCVASKAGATGKCAKRAAAAAPCDKDAWYDDLSENPCVKDHVCVELSAAATSAVCGPVVEIGKPCSSGDQCQGHDVACAGATPNAMTCSLLPAKGSACEPLDADEIEAGLLACLPPFVCSPKASKCVDRPAVGQACIEDKCAAALWCDVDDNGDGLCAAFGEVGSPCTTFLDESSSCEDGLVCGAKDNKCEAPLCK